MLGKMKKECIRCGKQIIKAKKLQKYCPKCRLEREREKKREYEERLRGDYEIINVAGIKIKRPKGFVERYFWCEKYGDIVEVCPRVPECEYFMRCRKSPPA